MEMKLPLVPPAPKNNWLFILGRETLLSLAEIKAVFLLKKIDYKITYQQDSKIIIHTEESIDPTILMLRLGGTIKIAYSIGKINTADTLAKFLNEKFPTGKIEFSINGGKTQGIETKKILKLMGRSARYIEAKNSATVIYNNLIKNGADIEMCNGETFISAAIQPIDEFSLRDFGRPGRDDHSGMLPPKLAMMMINLTAQKEDAIICDPFCGSGTIITEAMLMGYKNIIGCDISETAISDTNKNIIWLKDNFQIDETGLNVEVFHHDATIVSKRIKAGSVDAIAAEPFLGKPLHGTEQVSTLETQANELKNLYIKTFSEFKKILKPNGVVVFIIPRFKTKTDWIRINCESEILKLGYVNASILPEQKHLLYWRDTQHVGREIWRFKKV